MALCIVDNYYEKLIPQQRSEYTSLMAFMELHQLCLSVRRIFCLV